MALNKENSSGTSNKTDNTAGGFDPSAFAAAGPSDNTNTAGLFVGGGLGVLNLLNPVAAQSGDLYLNAAIKVFENELADHALQWPKTLATASNAKPGKIEMYVIDRNGTSFNDDGTRRAFSAIVLALPMEKINGQKTVIWNTILLEATGAPLAPRNVRIPTGDQNTFREIQEDQVTGDALNSDMTAVAAELIASVYPPNEYTSRNLRGFVLPRHAQPATGSEQKPDELFKSLVATAINVVRAEQVLMLGIKDINLAVLNKTGNIVASLSHGAPQTPVLDQCGDPVRSDMRVTVYMKRNINPQNLAVGAQYDNQQVLVVVHMYLDMQYTRNDNNAQLYRNPNDPMKPPFLPTLVISHLELPVGVSPSFVVLGVAAALLQIRQYNYVTPLYNQEVVPSGLKDVSLTDIGALNIEGNFKGVPGEIGPFVPSGPTEMNSEERRRYLAGLVNFETLAVAVDVPIGRPLSPILNFLAAMRHDGNAALMFAACADNLFNSNFTPKLLAVNARLRNEGYKEGTPREDIVRNIPMTMGNSEILLGGHYTLVGQPKRDLRQLDYLAVANYYRTYPERIRAFAESFVPNYGSLETRLFMRRAVLEPMTGPERTLTHRIDRVTLSNVLITALADTLADTNYLQVQGVNESVLQSRQVNSELYENAINPASISVGRIGASPVTQQGYSYAYRG